MTNLIRALLLLIASYPMASLGAKLSDSKIDESRQATRCAALYLLMSKIPALANEKKYLERIVDELGEIATANGATTEQINAWAKEFMADSAANAEIPDSNFNEEQSKTCQGFLDSHPSGTTTSPAPDKQSNESDAKPNSAITKQSKYA